MAKKRDAEADVHTSTAGFVEEFCTKPVYDSDGVQASSAIGLDGLEYPDPTPMAPPVGFDAPPDLMTMIRTMVKNELFTQGADREQFDSFEEAGDFDIEDDPLPPLTLHEALLLPSSEPTAPPSPAASPQLEAAKEGGQGGGSPEPAPPAPPAAPQSSTST